VSKASRGWRNPEFQRNLWLELSPTRLLLMPALIALLLFVVSAGLPKSMSSEAIAQFLLNLSLGCFMLLTVLWGTSLAQSSLTREFSEGTWDNQRMSGLTPWQMVWGKLLGGSIYAWYGGVILLTVMAVLAAMTGMPWGRILFYGAGLISLAVLFHAAIMLCDLTFWHKNSGMKVVMRPRLLILFSLLAVPTVISYMMSDTASIVWWGKNWRFMDIVVYTLIPMTFWTLVGLWQAMRRELLLHNHPWWWLAFMVFWMFWVAGFMKKDWGWLDWWGEFFGISAMLAWFGLYLQLFSERKDQGAWLRIIAAWKRHDISLMQHLLPLWTINAALVLVLSLITLLIAQHGDSLSKLFAFLGIVALMTRDITWTLWLNLAPNARRADGAALVSLLVFYWLLPMFGSLLPSPGNALFPSLPFLVRIVFDDISRTMAVFSMLTQAIAALWLFHGRWRKFF
jgi:hypothetical protein